MGEADFWPLAHLAMMLALAITDASLQVVCVCVICKISASLGLNATSDAVALVHSVARRPRFRAFDIPTCRDESPNTPITVATLFSI